MPQGKNVQCILKASEPSSESINKKETERGRERRGESGGANRQVVARSRSPNECVALIQ